MADHDEQREVADPLRPFPAPAAQFLGHAAHGVRAELEIRAAVPAGVRVQPW